MTNKYFTNWTAERFEYYWNSEKFTFEPGQSILYPAYLADHFGKHLTDKVLHSQGKQVSDQTREELLKKCFIVPAGKAAPSADEQSNLRAEIEALNSIAPQISSVQTVSSAEAGEVKRKAGRPPKAKTVETEKFDGLNVNPSETV